MDIYGCQWTGMTLHGVQGVASSNPAVPTRSDEGQQVSAG